MDQQNECCVARDCFMTSCTIVLNQDDAHHLDTIKKLLLSKSLIIDSVNDENGVIECTGESSIICNLSKEHLFSYVRVNFTYAAEFPADDPRDTNGQ